MSNSSTLCSLSADTFEASVLERLRIGMRIRVRIGSRMRLRMVLRIKIKDSNDLSYIVGSDLHVFFNGALAHLSTRLLAYSITWELRCWFT